MLEPNVKCLAYHGPLLYEAKILRIYDPNSKKIITKDGEKSIGKEIIPEHVKNSKGYFIHYKGWKSSWDEWVGIDRVLEYTQENINLQKSLKEDISKSIKKDHKDKDNKSRNLDENGSKNSNRRKRNHEEIDKPIDYQKKPEIHINIPSSLKTILVNDWEFVTKNHQLVPLPRNPNVLEILKDFKNCKIESLKNVDKDIFEEVLSGLRIYFDNSLGHILLYRFERTQYKEIVNNNKFKNKTPSEIYGAEHLLRLFSCLPGLIAQTSMDQQSISILKKYLEEFSQYLADHKFELFVKKYENTSPAYNSVSKV